MAIFPSSNSLMHYSEGSELCPHGNVCTATQLSLHLIAWFHMYVFRAHSECCPLGPGWVRRTAHCVSIWRDVVESDADKVGVHCTEFKGQRSNVCRLLEIEHAGQAVALVPWFIHDLMPVLNLWRGDHIACAWHVVWMMMSKQPLYGKIPLLWEKTHNTVWRCCVAVWTLYILHLIWQTAWSWACMYCNGRSSWQARKIANKWISMLKKLVWLGCISAWGFSLRKSPTKGFDSPDVLAAHCCLHRW